MNNRISAVRKHFGLTQEEFGKRLGISRNYVWMLERGEREPSQRTFKDICDKFNINDDWLRSGEGEMVLFRSREDEIAAFMGSVLDGPNNFKKRLIAVLANLDEDDWELLESVALALAEEIKENPGQE